MTTRQRAPSTTADTGYTPEDTKYVRETDTKYVRETGASAYLQDRGLPVTRGHLRKLRCIGGGPKFVHFGRFPMYTIPWLDEWVESKLSPVKTSTSVKE